MISIEPGKSINYKPNIRYVKESIRMELTINDPQINH